MCPFISLIPVIGFASVNLSYIGMILHMAIRQKYCWWQPEIQRSPVEVGSLSPYLQGFIHPNGGLFLGFLPTVPQATITKCKKNFRRVPQHLGTLFLIKFWSKWFVWMVGFFFWAKPPVNYHSNGWNIPKRCISYKTWGYSTAMLDYQRVIRKDFFKKIWNWFELCCMNEKAFFAETCETHWTVILYSGQRL